MKYSIVAENLDSPATVPKFEWVRADLESLQHLLGVPASQRPPAESRDNDENLTRPLQIPAVTEQRMHLRHEDRVAIVFFVFPLKPITSVSSNQPLHFRNWPCTFQNGGGSRGPEWLDKGMRH